jgi:hypothetical protein
MLLTTVQLKELNTELLKTVLKKEKYCTKPDLARLTGLSVSTCGNILKDLLASQEVIEIEGGQSSGGRPARVFMFNENYSAVASIYARKEKDEVTLVCAVSNLLGLPVFETTLAFDDIGLREIQTAISLLLDQYPNIRVVGLGLPAVIHQGAVGYCDFPQLTGLSIIDLLEKKFPVQIVAENDVNATAMGYHRRNLHGSQDGIAYLYYPKSGNAGSGIILNGHILRGSQNFAGEISFLPLGVSLEDQGPLQDDPEAFADFVCRTIQSINAVINPKSVVCAGLPFTENLQIDIHSKLLLALAPEHRPRLVFESDIHDNYLYGLTMLALEKLSCSIQIIERY